MGIKLLTRKEITAVKAYEFAIEALAAMGKLPKEFLILGKPFNKRDQEVK